MVGTLSAADMLATMLFPRQKAAQPWRLSFDKSAMERDFARSAFFHERTALLQTLVVLSLVATAWLAYAIVGGPSSPINACLSISFGTILALFLVILAALIVLSHRFGHLKCRYILLAVSLAIVLISSAAYILPPIIFQSYFYSTTNNNNQSSNSLASNQLNVQSAPPTLTAAGVFSLYALTVFVAYTLVTAPFVVVTGISLLLTVLVEVLLNATSMLLPFSTSSEGVIARLLIHLAIHLIGLAVRIVYEGRLRTGFWYGAHSLIASQRLDVEKRLRQKLILSIMPQAFAQKIFSPQITRNKSMRRTPQQQQSPSKKGSKQLASVSGSETDDATILASAQACQHEKLSSQVLTAFRPKPPTNYWLPEASKSDLELLHDFHVEKYENVSIIYANICGFTNISSKKRPEEWVPLLNDIFDHFDSVCWATGCEKISILGDRYICLSGCPTPRVDAAHCCVEAGLGMCSAVEKFNAKYNEELSIRVGIHTGTLQCGLFGTKRYKFDIWGDDVNFTNDVLESSDKPGRVLISADTYMFLKDDYELEESKEIFDFRKTAEINEYFDPVLKRMVMSSKKTTASYFIVKRMDKSAATTTRGEETGGGADILPLSPAADSALAPLLLKTNNAQTEEQTNVESQHFAPTSFTEPPVHPLTLAFTNPDVESDFNSRFAYEPLPQNELVFMDISASMLKKSSSLVDFYAADGLTFTSAASSNLLHAQASTDAGSEHQASPNKSNNNNKKPVSSGISSKKPSLMSASIISSSNCNKYALRNIPSDSERCLLSDAVFPNAIAFGDTISSLVVCVLVLIVLIVSSSPAVSTAFVVSAGVGFVAISVLLLASPALPLIVDKRPPFAAATVSPIDASFRAGLTWRVIQIILGSLFGLFPALLAIASHSTTSWSNYPQNPVYIAVVIVTLLHFSFFAQVPYYVRTVLATLVATSVGLLLCLSHSSSSQINNIATLEQSLNEQEKMGMDLAIVSAGSGEDDVYAATIINPPSPLLTTTADSANEKLIADDARFYYWLAEVLIGLFGIVAVVCLAARRSELAARVAWYIAVESRLIACAVQKAQRRNDQLLAYVVPLHVLDRFSAQQIYYQHHPNCGVIVVRIANFADYYEESFSGRDGSLHVLNQIFSEFEALLEKRRFKDVEKVKTSVPSLLCAAGLDAHRRTMQREKTAHLYALMAYCFELLDALRQFNQPRQFKFKMRIGFNTGDLVSGILGSTLLNFDVWGDTVNIANTMCLQNTCDAEGVIQVSETAVDLLKERFNFEAYNPITISGKGEVKTYLAVSEKPITYEHLVPPPGGDTHFVDE